MGKLYRRTEKGTVSRIIFFRKKPSLVLVLFSKNGVIYIQCENTVKLGQEKLRSNPELFYFRRLRKYKVDFEIIQLQTA